MELKNNTILITGGSSGNGLELARQLLGLGNTQPNKLVAATIKGLQKDKFEIFPGIARVLKFMSRFAPGLIFNQISKMAGRSLARPTAAINPLPAPDSFAPNKSPRSLTPSPQG